MSFQSVSIKCGNSDCGAHLLDSIKQQLNDRLLSGSIAVIQRIHSTGDTWIIVDIHYTQSCSESTREHTDKYILGMVTGILIWSGVDVI